jgi:ABC-2 type transport system permease protein
MPIFDQGYQHWSGELAGHGWRWFAIARRGVRNALQARSIRLLMLFAWIPALILATALCLWGLLERQSALIDSIRPLLNFLGQTVLAGPREYRTEVWTICYRYFLWYELQFSMLLVLLAGPSLISQDLRYNALPLYFSRPLRRIDYFFGKLGTVVGLLAMIAIVPGIIAYVLGLLFSLDATIIRDTYRILIASVAYGLCIAVSAGMLILALSALSRNSRYVALFWLAVWFVTGTVSLLLIGFEREQQMHRRFQRGVPFQRETMIAEQLEAAKTDWRPVVSYTGNLTRLGDQMLGTRKAWEKFSEIRPAGKRGMILGRLMDMQHPWQWSALVLASLFAVSVCILNLSVKPLDRLR